MFSYIDDTTYDDYVSTTTCTSSTDVNPIGSTYVANNHNFSSEKRL
jgi:hypothetical protein